MREICCYSQEKYDFKVIFSERRFLLKDEIKQIMKMRGIKHKDLAEKLGISSENLSHQMKRDNFRIKDLEKIAVILNCDFKYFFIPKENNK